MSSKSVVPLYLTLRHSLGTSDYRNNPRPGVDSTWREHFVDQSVRLDRPSSGQVSHVIRCSVCGKEMTVRLAAPDAVAKLRRTYRTRAALAFGYAGIVIAQGLLTRGLDAPAWLLAIRCTAFLAVPVGLLLLNAGGGSDMQMAVKFDSDSDHTLRI